MRRWLGIATLGLVLGGPAAWAKEPATVGGGHMQHCPTAVAGAKTEIKDNKDSVEITVTSTDAAKTEEIRKRAKHMVDAAKQEPTSVVHNGEGHGGGGLGVCEVVLKDTTVTAEDVDGGSKITVKPNKPVDFEWLKKETHARHMATAGGGKKKAAKAATP
jgi:TusA-related sulfurtransferase